MSEASEVDRDKLVLWWLEASLGACGAVAIIIAVVRLVTAI